MKTDTWIIIRFLMQNYTSLAYVLVLCITMSLLLGFFFCYHVRQASQGFTTNEKYKLGEMKNECHQTFLSLL